jgi:membrane fusion protein (multidrug efflux system)
MITASLLLTTVLLASAAQTEQTLEKVRPDAVLELSIGGGALASQDAQAQSPPREPGVKQETHRSQESQTVPSGRQAEVEALKKEIEALRKKVEALARKDEQPRLEHPKIVVTTPKAQDVVITQQYVCQIHAQHHINVRALQSGYLAEIPVKEGQAVKKGDVLFKILPTLYQAKLDVVLAEVQLAQIEFDNTNRLFKDKVVSPNEVALSQAKLAKAKAKTRLAEAEVNFTTGRAPFDGIVGKLQTQQGSVIKEGETLTTLSDNSFVWVYFNVPEVRYFEYMTNLGHEKEARPIELVLANGSKFPHTGKIGAIDARFNNENGCIPFRADFPNPDRLLRHGQTGNVLMHRTLKNAIVIPQRATFENLDRRYVYVVGKDDTVHQREIVIQHEMDGSFVVKQGLAVNDRIVLEGVRQVHDGEKVKYEFRKPQEGPR